jgi:DNA polymerase III beta subunit, N-terminal domain
MRVSCDRLELVNELQVITRFTASRDERSQTPAVVLGATAGRLGVLGVLLRAEASELCIAEHERESWVSDGIEADVECEGAVVVSATLLLDFLEKVQDRVVEIAEAETAQELVVKSKDETLRLQTFAAQAARLAKPEAPVAVAEAAKRPTPPERPRASRAVLTSTGPITHPLLLGALSLLLLGTAFISMPSSVREGFLILSAAIAALVPVAAAWRSGAFDIVELGVVVGLAYLALFPLRAIVVLAGLDPAANANVLNANDVIKQKALIFIALGLLAGGAGYLSPFGARLGRRIHVPAVSVVEAPTLAPSLALFAVGILAEAAVLAMNTFPGSLGALAGRVSGVVSGTTVFVLVGLCLLARSAAIDRRRVDVAALLCAICLTVLVGLFGQFKEIAILGLIAPLLMWHLSKKGGLRVRWFVLSAILVIFVIFPIVTVVRWASLTVGSSNPSRVAPAFVDQAVHHDWVTKQPRGFRPYDPVVQPLAVTSHRLYGYESLTLAIRYTPSENPYLEGATLQNLAAGLVPRVLWPEKPKIGIGYWFSVNYWGTPPGVPVVPQTITHPGELYIDFGIAGLIVGLAVLGFWYRFAWEATRPRESATAALLYTLIFVTVIDVDRDLPLVYVTLVQRLATATLLIALIEGGRRLSASWRKSD